MRRLVKGPAGRVEIALPVRVAIGLVAGLLLLALGVPIAQASPKGVVEAIGAAGSGDGQFSEPQGVAVDPGDGSIYVVDRGNARVEKFDSSGSYVSQFGAPGSGDGQFSEPQGIAVDPDDGSVYVADTGNSRIEKFSSSGAFVAKFGSLGEDNSQFWEPQGVAVDPSDGSVYVADTGNNRVQRFDSSGTFLSKFGTAGGEDGQFFGPAKVAVDSNGSVYVLELYTRVQKFDSTGAFVGQFAPVTLTRSPQNLAVDPANDHVDVVQYASDYSELWVLEFDSSGTLLDTHVEGAGLSSIAGLAVNPGNGDVYLSSPYGAGRADRVFRLGTVDSPGATIAPPTEVEGHSASFHGTVSPDGIPASYRFEYSSDGSSWTRIPAEADADAGHGAAGAPVTVQASGLIPGTSYQLRLVVSRTYGGAPAAVAETTFDTPQVKPTTMTLDAGAKTANSLELGGWVNPENLPTTYYFELSTHEDLSGAVSVPATQDGSAGSGTSVVAASELAVGLSPDTTYFTRLVATNAAGTSRGQIRSAQTAALESPAPSCPNEDLRRGASAALPECRAYELVTTASKGGYGIQPNYGGIQAAIDGNRIAYSSVGAFGDGRGSGATNWYMSLRGTDGWALRNISPPADPFPALVSMGYVHFTPDLSSGLTATNSSSLPGSSAKGGLNYYQYHTDTDSFSLKAAVPLPVDGSVPAPFRSMDFQVSDNERHMIMGDEKRLLPEAPALSGYSENAYEWENGQWSYLGEKPGGGYFDTPTGPGTTNLSHKVQPRMVAEDGTAIFSAWTYYGPDPTEHYVDLFARKNGQTIKVNEPAPGGQDPHGLGELSVMPQTMSRDGSKVLFSSSQRLTANSTAGAEADAGSRKDLYLRNLDDGSLVDLTTQDPEGGLVLGTVAATDDLRTIYFVASGDLDGDGPARREDANLYRWRAGQGIDYLASLNRAEEPGWWYADSWSYDLSMYAARESRMTPDGRHLLFVATGRVTAFDSKKLKEIYLYDADTGRVSCVSCPKPGVEATVDTALRGTEFGLSASSLAARLRVNITDDGSKVFFETAEALVPQDTNGAIDVYEYDVRTGRQTLLSTGTSPNDSHFAEMSPDGSNVFITTRQPLVAADRDSSVDLYDARIGGGFATASAPGPCSGTECQGAPSAAPGEPQIGTAAAAGKGNSLARRPKCRKAKAKQRGARPRCAAARKKQHAHRAARRGHSKRRAGK